MDSLRWLLKALLLIGAAHGVPGQAEIWPASGLWWQAGANGKFMEVHVGPGGYALVSLSYSDGTAPTYRVLQGQLSASNPAATGRLALLESPLYRVDNAGCLSCDELDGSTVTEDPAVHRLTFINGTNARLLLPSGQELRYEFFPLITRHEETIAQRYANGRLLVREGENSAQAEPLVLAQIPRVCMTSLSADMTLIKLNFNVDASHGDRISTVLKEALIAIEPGINPAITLLSVSSIAAQAKCHGGGCPPPLERCEPIGQLSESLLGLAGYMDTLGTKHGQAGEVQIWLLE